MDFEQECNGYFVFRDLMRQNKIAVLEKQLRQVEAQLQELERVREPFGKLVLYEVLWNESSSMSELLRTRIAKHRAKLA
jgi:hypothetical protein